MPFPIALAINICDFGQQRTANICFTKNITQKKNSACIKQFPSPNTTFRVSCKKRDAKHATKNRFLPVNLRPALGNRICDDGHQEEEEEEEWGWGGAVWLCNCCEVSSTVLLLCAASALRVERSCVRFCCGVSVGVCEKNRTYTLCSVCLDCYSRIEYIPLSNGIALHTRSAILEYRECIYRSGSSCGSRAISRFDVHECVIIIIGFANIYTDKGKSSIFALK